MIKISYSGLLILMLSTFAFAKPSVSDCQKLKEIESRNVTVYYPEFVPERFSKISISSDFVEIEGKDYFDYKVELCDANQLCFSVASMSEGIGSPPSGSRILSGTSKIFGKFSVEVFEPGTEGNDSSEVYYLSDWLWLSDSGPGPVVIDLEGTYDTNRYFGTYEKREDGSVFIDLNDEGYFTYERIGTLKENLHILKTSDSGGGSGIFMHLLLVKFIIDYEYAEDASRRYRLVIQRLGSVSLCDRFAGPIQG